MLEGLEEIIFFLCQQCPGMCFQIFSVQSALLNMSPSPIASFAMEATGACWGKAKVIDGME